MTKYTVEVEHCKFIPRCEAIIQAVRILKVNGQTDCIRKFYRGGDLEYNSPEDLDRGTLSQLNSIDGVYFRKVT